MDDTYIIWTGRGHYRKEYRAIFEAYTHEFPIYVRNETPSPVSGLALHEYMHTRNQAEARGYIILTPHKTYAND